MGPPRMALGSWGLPAKPRAMAPPSMARNRSRICCAAAMPSQGVRACSIPGSFFRKRPPLAMMSPSLATSPAVVSRMRPPSRSPVASPATWVTPMRRKKLSRGRRRSSPLRSPEGTQISPG